MGLFTPSCTSSVDISFTLLSDRHFGSAGHYFEYQAALRQAARYAHQRQLATITIVFFVEAVDDETRARYETPYQDANTSVTVEPVLVTTVE